MDVQSSFYFPVFFFKFVEGDRKTKKRGGRESKYERKRVCACVHEGFVCEYGK